MTRWYWTKIVLGMLAIFVVGLGVTQGLSVGKDKVNELVASDATISLPMLGMPFMFNGASLGQLQKLRIERSSPSEIDAIHLTVRLDSDSILALMADCQISLDDFETIDEHSSFVCIEPVDSITRGMDRFGTVRFQPSGEVHILLAPAEIRSKLAAVDSQDIVADGVSDVAVRVNGETVVRISQGSHQLP